MGNYLEYKDIGIPTSTIPSIEILNVSYVKDLCVCSSYDLNNDKNGINMGEAKYYCQNCGAQIKSTDTICPKCGKNLKDVGRRVEVTIVDNITLSDSVETSLIINPIPEIEKSLKEQDYFRAATFLAAILEYYGKLAINGKFQTENRNVDPDRIERFSLEDVAIILYGLKIIDQPCYSALRELNKLRRNLLHIKDAVEFRRISGRGAEATIKKAMKCIDILVK